MRTTLFHGTNAELSPGEIVKPGRDFAHAYATSDESLAREYGNIVYEVHPVDEKEAREYTQQELSQWVGEIPNHHRAVVKSGIGFVVVNRLD